MAYTFFYKDFIFIEGQEPTAKILGPIEYKKSFTFNSQSKTLDCVKDQLLEKAKALGGNAVINFKYGQQTANWFKSCLFGLDDDIKWYGSGTAAILPPEKIEEIKNKKVDN